MAAVAVAAQLSVADVLGIVRWDGSAPDGVATWTPLLTWVAFIYAVGVVVGAMFGRRALRGPNRPAGIAARIAATLFSGVGAAAAVPLAWLPSRGARPPAHVDPMLVVSITCSAGIVVGLIVSMIALSARPVSAGVRVWIAWLWLIAIGSATVGVVRHLPYPPPRLGVIDAPSLIPVAWWNGPKVMIAVAAVVGLAVAGVARGGGAGRFGTAISGLGGPAIVAVAYLVAGPGGASERPSQFDPYVASLLATAAGLVASVLVAMLGRRVKAPARVPVRQERLVGEVVDADQSAYPAAPAYPEPAYASSPSWNHPTPAPAAGGTVYGAPQPTAPQAIAPKPTMGQPPIDPYESWVRELGPTGRHAQDER
jgi:hypothetical protein